MQLHLALRDAEDKNRFITTVMKDKTCRVPTPENRTGTQAWTLYINPANYSVWTMVKDQPKELVEHSSGRDEAVAKAVNKVMQKQPNLQRALMFLDVTVIGGVFRNGECVSGEVRLSIRQIEDVPEVNRLIPVDIELPDALAISKFVQDTKKVVKAVGKTRDLDDRELQVRKSMYSTVCAVVKKVSRYQDSQQAAEQAQQQQAADHP